jgi:molybdopterin-dependent oxidoreductase-like protein protein
MAASTEKPGSTATMKIHPMFALPALLLSACASTGPARSPAIEPSAPASAASIEQPAHDPRLHAAPPAAPLLASPVVVPLDANTLASLPREPVTATAHNQTLHCDGIPLLALLRAAGAMPAEPLRGAQLTRYVQVNARDGYRALFALAELDPTLGNRKVFLTDRCDGKPLPEDDGPLRLVVPEEARPARWVRQVASITVIVAP